MMGTNRVGENGTASPDSPGPDEFIFRVGQVINGRFHILRIVAQGGMGVVCEAFDNKLGERVALKCAKEGLGGHLPPEVRNAREITHPNVCKIFEIHTTTGDHGSFDFISMEFIAGETLSERLRRNKSLGKTESLTIARQLCAGLAEAHRKRVIHGDLKSSNVILAEVPDGLIRAVITDFGLARLRGVAVAAASSDTVAGTPRYMAPELWKGSPPSVASDIYALGVMLSDLLSTSSTPRIATDAPTLSWNEAKPPEPTYHGAKHNRVIGRCLETDPDRRFGSVEEVAEALGPSQTKQWLGRIAVALLIVMVTALAARWAARTPRETVRLAILPFTADPEATAIAKRLAASASGEIERLKGDARRDVVVVPIAETIHQKVNTAEQAGSLLKATHVLSVSFDSKGDGFILQALLTDGRTHSVLGNWHAEYDRSESDLAPLALAGFISETLHTPPLVGNTHVNAKARPYYLRGLKELHKDSTADSGLAAMRRAVSADPGSALTYAGLAEAQWIQFHLSHDPKWLRLAEDSTSRAAARNPDLSAVHSVAGQIAKEKGLYQAAISEMERAIELQPEDATEYRRLGQAYEANGQLEKARAALSRSIELAPRDYRPYLAIGAFDYNRGDFADAVTAFRKAVELGPDEVDTHYSLGSTYIELGQYTDAERELRRAILTDRETKSLDALGLALLYQDRGREAIPIFLKVANVAPKKVLPWFHLGLSYRLTGETEPADAAFRNGLQSAEKQLAEDPRDSYVRAQLAYLCAVLNEKERAMSEVTQALQLAPHDADVQSFAVLTFEILGARERTLDVLRTATKEVLSDLNRWPDVPSLQQDPRFKELLVARGG